MIINLGGVYLGGVYQGGVYLTALDIMQKLQEDLSNGKWRDKNLHCPGFNEVATDSKWNSGKGRASEDSRFELGLRAPVLLSFSTSSSVVFLISFFSFYLLSTK